jgi:hypothetical protein
LCPSLLRLGFGLALAACVSLNSAESIHPGTVTPAARYSDAPNWELGTVFRPTAPGKVTQVRVFALAEESGEHQVRLWRNRDAAVVAGPIPWTFGGEEAWIALDIPDVALEANEDYTITVSTAADGWYPANATQFASAGGNGQNLSYPQGAGVFSDTAGTRPTGSFNNSAYLRDVVFEPDLAGGIMRVEGNGIRIADGDLVASLADATQFGGASLAGAGRDRVFTIVNAGQGALELGGTPKVAVTGAHAGDFTVTAAPTSPVAPGGRTTFTVRFMPSARGVRDALVSITNSASPGRPYAFALQGVGVGGGNRTLGNRGEGTIIQAINADSINGNRYQALRDMRITEVRAKVAALSGQLKCAVYSDRDGQADRLLALTAPAVNPAAGWVSLNATAPLEITAGSFYWLLIWSDTAGAGVYADLGAQQSASYAFGDWPDPISLTGAGTASFCVYAEGIPLGLAGPEMEVQSLGVTVADGTAGVSGATGTDFGAASVQNGRRERIYTIYNVGTTPLDLTGSPRAVVGGANAGDFAVTAQPAASVAPGASTTFTVGFDPAAVGVRTATIAIARGDSPADPYDFAIHGVGLGGGSGVLGHDSEGTSWWAIRDTQIHGNRFQSPRDMRIGQIHAKVLELAGTFKCAVYSDTGGFADRLLRSTVELANATNGWNVFALTAPLDLSAGDYYWLAIWSDSADARVQIDPVGTALWATYAYADLAGQWPDPVNLTGAFLEKTYCIYAEGKPLGTVSGPAMDVRGKGKLIESGDATPSELDGTDLGSLAVSSSTPDRTFTIENPGDAPLELAGPAPVSITGAQAGDFTVSAQPAGTVPPGGSASFKVRFRPSVRGFRSATVSIASVNPGATPYEFAIQGAGFATGRESIWADTRTGKPWPGDTVPYALGTIFRSSVAGKITHLRVYAIAIESGDHTARLWRNDDDSVIGGPYTWNYGGANGWITLDIPDVAIEPGVDYTVVVSVGRDAKMAYPNLGADVLKEGGNGQHLSYPASAGVFAENRDVRPTQSYNGGNYLRDVVFVPAGATVDLPDIEIKGNAVSIADGARSPGSADGTDFGAAAVGGAGIERTFTILNPGTAPLQLSSTPRVAITGPQAGDFKILAQPASPIAPGGGTSLTIRFSPSATGARGAVVSIDNDSDRNPFDFAIAGTGAAATASLRIAELAVDRATDGIRIRWEGEGPQFQVEKAAAVNGPFQPVGPAQSERAFTDPGALRTDTQRFYRVRRP